jgi:hypothetical protein
MISHGIAEQAQRVLLAACTARVTRPDGLLLPNAAEKNPPGESHSAIVRCRSLLALIHLSLRLLTKITGSTCAKD